jgi:hypothetical protein
LSGECAIHPFLRRARTGVGYLIAFGIIAAGSIWLSLQVAPMQSVSAAGQTARVGAAFSSLSWSGPGELDLFGQVVPTKPRFQGPIRPLLQLTHITIDRQVAQLVRSDDPGELKLSLSQQLAQGWTRFFVFQTLIAAGFAAVALIAVAGVRRQSYRTMLKTTGAGLAVVCAVNVGGVLLTASTTPGVLRSVKTLDDLVGSAPLAVARGPAARALPGVQAVVIGDSTAAAAGNPIAPGASALDRACGRSSASYAADLAAANHWTVLNLACNSATITDGLLGVQVAGNGQLVPPQLTVAEQATHAQVVIVSVGADDVQWSIMTRLCLASAVCNDKVSTAYFNQLLGAFTRSYYQLLGSLDDLPGRPPVLVNEYYSPFGSDIGCLARYGLTAAKANVLLARLGQLNAVLAQGAQVFGFGAVDPSFAGHQLCSAGSYVQGPADPAPLHPTAAGELAIALADQQALPAAQNLIPAPAVSPAAASPAAGTD